MVFCRNCGRDHEEDTNCPTTGQPSEADEEVREHIRTKYTVTTAVTLSVGIVFCLVGALLFDWCKHLYCYVSQGSYEVGFWTGIALLAVGGAALVVGIPVALVWICCCSCNGRRWMCQCRGCCCH